MIARVWHGWTTTDNAGRYEDLLRTTVFPGIAARSLEGYRGITLLCRHAASEEEFVTIMWFDTLDAVSRFAGEDYEAAYVPSEARALLARWDERSRHYEVVEPLATVPAVSSTVPGAPRP